MTRKNTLSKSIECLIIIDRNFKLDASQTTVNSEKLKAENSHVKSQIESMMDILNSSRQRLSENSFKFIREMSSVAWLN